MLALALALVILGVPPRERLGREESHGSRPLLLTSAFSFVLGCAVIGRVTVVAALIILAVTAFHVGVTLRAHKRRAAEAETLARDVGELAATLRTGALYQQDSAPDSPRVRALGTVAATYGVPLAGLLESAQATMDRQLQHDKQTVAQLQGPITTAGILTALPIIGVLMGAAIGADSVHYLLGGGTGGIVLIAGVGCIAAGVFWSMRIITGALT